MMRILLLPSLISPHCYRIALAWVSLSSLLFPLLVREIAFPFFPSLPSLALCVFSVLPKVRSLSLLHSLPHAEGIG
jgi:hypothetical protein